MQNASSMTQLTLRNPGLQAIGLVFMLVTASLAQAEPTTESADSESKNLTPTSDPIENINETASKSHSGDKPQLAIDESELLPLVLDFARSDNPDLQIRALLKAKALNHPFLLPHIRYLARVGTNSVRIVACETLAAYRNVQGLVELQLAAKDKDDGLAVKAIQLLSGFPLPSIRQELLSIIQDPTSALPRKKQAIASLHTMGTPEAQDALLQLASSLPEPLATLARTEQSTETGNEPKRLILLRRLFTTEHLSGRLEALAMVNEYFPSSQALKLLQTCLQDPDQSIRRTALESAAGLNPKDLEVILKDTHLSTDTHTQRTWLKLIKKLPEDHARPLLLQSIERTFNPSFRRAALKELSTSQAHLDDQETTTAIITLFNDASTDPAKLAIAAALSKRPSESAFLALIGILGQNQLDERIRMLAFDTLVDRKPTNYVEKLIELAQHEPSLDIRKKAAQELVLNHCDELAERCSEFDYHYPSEAAAGLYYTVSGAMGAASLGLLSNVAGGNQPAIAALSGAVLGSGTAYMLAPDEGITMPEAFHFTSLGLWGSAFGYGLGAIAVDGLDQPAFSWSFLGGQLLGTSLGALTFKETSHTSHELALMHWTGIEVSGATLGALLLWGDENPTDYQKQMGPALATLAGLGLGVAPMWFLAKDLEFSKTDKALVTLGTLGSGVLGSLAAYGTSDKEGAAVGGFLLGQGIGYLASLATSQHVELSAGELSWISVGTTLGSTLGAGIAYTATSGNDDQALSLGGFIGGLTLTAATSLTKDYFDLTFADTDLAIYSGLVGSVLGGSIALMSDTDFMGHALIGTSTGLMAGLIYDHLNPVSLRDSSLGASGALAGLTLGTGLALMYPDEASELDAGILIGAGTLIGYTSLLWAAPKLTFSNGDYLSTFGALAIGTFAGGSLSGLIYGPEEESQHTLGGALVGSALGYAAGLAVTQYSDLDNADVTETLFMTSLGGMLGQGFTAFTPDDGSSVRGNRLLSLTGTGLGLAAGYFFADQTSYTKEDYWLISYLSAYGGFNGAWFPALWLESSDNEKFSSQSTGGALIGASLGATSGIMLSQFENFSFDDINEMALGSLASSLFGAGIGLMVPVDDSSNMRPWVTGMQTAGILGTAAVALMAPHTDFSEGDTTLGFLATAYGAWQGAGASLLLDGTDRQVAGAVLATTALGAAGGAAISQHVEATTAELFAAFSGSVWGAWIGGMGSVALQQDFDIELSNKELLGSFFVASDLGLIATAVAMSPLVDMRPEQVGWINLYGLSGMALGSALGAIFPDVPFWTSNVSGSAAGLILGAIMTSYIEMPSLESTPTPETQSSEGDATTTSSGFYYPGQITAVLPQFQITPITGPDGRIYAEGNRFLLGFMGLWD